VFGVRVYNIYIYFFAQLSNSNLHVHRQGLYVTLKDEEAVAQCDSETPLKLKASDLKNKFLLHDTRDS